MKDFLTNKPILTGDEEVIARAGQGMEDPWAKEDQSPGIYGLKLLVNKKGKLTPKYKKLIKELHMVDLKPTQPTQPSSKIEKLNKKWRKLQQEKKHLRVIATQRIERFQTGFTKEDINEFLIQKKG